MSDLLYILQWWFYLLIIGILFIPFSFLLFSKFIDRGYIFSKTVGIVILSYITFLLGTLHLLPFQQLTIYVVLMLALCIEIYILKKIKINIDKRTILFFIIQEVLFLVSLIFWSYIKGFQSDIHGLEKFMDFGFMNSILRSQFFPPIDMWFPPNSINYYYFGHLVTAFLIKLTGIPTFIAYNLMLSTIFAFTVTSAFCLVSTFSINVLKSVRTSILAGLLGGVLTSLGGNLHTIYSFFTPYNPPESPVPFWQLKFNPGHFSEVTKGVYGWIDGFPNNYWYPNATRFIPFTIHEFPSYSFVVSDLHGHVLDIPFVFLTLGLMYSMFLIKKVTLVHSVVIGFMLAVMYMTNAWDGIIYFVLFFLSVLILISPMLASKKASNQAWFNISSKIKNTRNKFLFAVTAIKYTAITGVCYLIFSLPFSASFKPFVSGIGVVCAPDFLTKIGKIGPLIFEPNHCGRSPFWMIVILYGFFYFFAVALVIKILNLKKTPITLIYILLLILLSTILIAVPEFIYAKDIYPAHYRANTMFKLGYQAFIMLSLVSSFAIAYLLNNGRKLIWLPVTLFLLTLVLIYPYFAINSYFGNLKEYKGLNGLTYLKTLFPEDYDAIYWIQKNIKGQPVMLEAQGDSYTDYGRISANTGLPTPLGWTVHEWLWRGDYSFPQSRLEDSKLLYEGTLQQIKSLAKKYNVTYVYVGDLERTKYPNLDENKFRQLGKVVYQNGDTRIYQLSSL